MPLRIGLISDTHGLVRPEALAALAGADALIHAGDVCGAHVFEALRAIAPVHAVRGNNDTDAWGRTLPSTLRLRFEGVDVLVVHDVAEAEPGPARIVVTGHSHRPSVAEREGRLWVNPGSAGPRRFKLPVTVGWLRLDGDRASATIVDLPVAPPKSRRA